MRRISETRKAPPGAPQRTKDGKAQVKVRVDGKDQWFDLTESGRYSVVRPEWYASLKMADGSTKKVRLLRDRAASETMLADLRRREERILAGLETPIRKTGENFPKIVERYWRSRARNGRCTPVYLERSEAILRLNLSELGVGSIEDLARLGKSAVEKWVDSLLAKDFASGTVNQRIIQLKLFFAWALKDGLIAKVPPIERLSETVQEKRRAITRVEVDKLRQFAPWPRPLWYALLFCTLARRSALLAITSKDLFLDDQNPFLMLRAENAKTKIDQEIPLPVWLLPELRRLVSEEIPGRRLFWRMDGWNLNDEMDKDLKAAGIDKHNQEGKLVIHSFRHGGTTELLRNGVNILLVQRMGGWASLDMLATHYAHLSPLREREDIDRVFSRPLNP